MSRSITSRLSRHRRWIVGARVARPPAAEVDKVEEIRGQPVEQSRLFDVHQVPRRRNDREPGGGTYALEEKPGLERARVLVADHDECRHLEAGELRRHALERGAPHLDAAYRVGVALRRMLGEAREELAEGARVLVVELYAVGRVAIGFRCGREPAFLEAARGSSARFQ